jgi:hypothetical protein
MSSADRPGLPTMEVSDTASKALHTEVYHPLYAVPAAMSTAKLSAEQEVQAAVSKADSLLPKVSIANSPDFGAWGEPVHDPVSQDIPGSNATAEVFRETGTTQITDYRPAGSDLSYTVVNFEDGASKPDKVTLGLKNGSSQYFDFIAIRARLTRTILRTIWERWQKTYRPFGQSFGTNENSFAFKTVLICLILDSDFAWVQTFRQYSFLTTGRHFTCLTTIVGVRGRRLDYCLCDIWWPFLSFAVAIVSG